MSKEINFSVGTEVMNNFWNRRIWAVAQKCQTVRSFKPHIILKVPKNMMKTGANWNVLSQSSIKLFPVEV